MYKNTIFANHFKIIKLKKEYGINDDLYANNNGILGLAYMMVKKSWVMKQDAGNGKMKEISDHIYEGALAFLKAEYRLLTISLLE